MRALFKVVDTLRKDDMMQRIKVIYVERLQLYRGLPVLAGCVERKEETQPCLLYVGLGKTVGFGE